MGHTSVPLEEYLEVWGAARRDVIWIPSQQRYGRAASATNSDRLDSIKAGA
jgi:pre-mRNA-splicing factor CDC5/CEF1